MSRIDGFLEHPAVEMQPGQFAVNEAFRACRNRRTGMDFVIFFFESNDLCGIHEGQIHPASKQCRRKGGPLRSMCYRDDVSMTLGFRSAAASSRICEASSVPQQFGRERP